MHANGVAPHSADLTRNHRLQCLRCCAAPAEAVRGLCTCRSMAWPRIWTADPRIPRTRPIRLDHRGRVPHPHRRRKCVRFRSPTGVHRSRAPVLLRRGRDARRRCRYWLRRGLRGRDPALRALHHLEHAHGHQLSVRLSRDARRRCRSTIRCHRNFRCVDDLALANA